MHIVAFGAFVLLIYIQFFKLNLEILEKFEFQVKIGSVAPDIIHRNVKTCRDNIRNLHILAPGKNNIFNNGHYEAGLLKYLKK